MEEYNAESHQIEKELAVLPPTYSEYLTVREGLNSRRRRRRAIALLSANHALNFHLLQGGAPLTETDDSPATEDRKDAASAAQDDKEYQGKEAHLSKKDADPKDIEDDSSAQRQEHSIGSDRNDSSTDRFIEKDHGPSGRFVARERYVFHHDEGASQTCDNHDKEPA